MSDAVATPPAPKAAKSGLQAEFRGVPVWGWIALVLVVGGAVYYFQSRAGVKSAAPVADPSNPGPGTVNGAGAGAGGYQTVGNMPQTTTAETTRILTNNAWYDAAMKWMVQHGHDATDADAALQNYLSGERLTKAQNDIVELAIVNIGPKPEMASGPAPKMHALNQPKSGNIIGQLFHGIGSFLGLDDPGNIFAPYINPFLNNVIDHGPIGGVFQSINDLVGGSISVSGSANNVNIPGVGNVGIGGNIGTNGVSVNGSLPGVGQVGVGINPTGGNQYLGNYTVNSGDTLSSISQKVYGSTAGANTIYSANSNKIPNPNKLTVGTVLQIPKP